MPNILLTGGKRFAARAATIGLCALAVAAPASTARAVVGVSSVALSPSSASAAVNVAQTYTVGARDAMGNLIAGQALNLDLQSTVASPAQPISVTGVAAVVASGTTGAWLVSGTVTTGAGGTATFTVAASVASSVTVRVFAGTAPFNGSQASNTATLFTSGPTGSAAVTSLSASPVTATQAVGAGQSATVHAYDSMGNPVANVVPAALVSGPNGGMATCSTTDVTGAATCSYSNPNVGSDTFTIYVNRPIPMGTPGLDPGEPSTTVTRISTPAALPPTVTVPANIIRSVRSGRPGETVRFTASATDPVDGSLTPTCVPPSGTLFPVGVTTVTCTATNSHGLSASAVFTITVLIKTA